MKIAVDVRAACNQRTGKGVYTLEITNTLIAQYGESIITYGAKGENSDDVEVHVRLDRSLWHLRTCIDVLWKFHKGLIDTYFSPTSFIVAFILICVRKLGVNTPKVYITVHDLIAFKFPDTHERKATLIERITLPLVARNADGIFCVSDATKKDLQKLFHTEDSRCFITYNGVNMKFFNANANSKSPWEKPYILALGTLIPRKNLKLTLQAFKTLDIEMDLVVIGGEGWGDYLEKDLKENPKVHFLGYVPFSKLPDYYRHAKAFIFPSLYEGFGIPPLEAQACGCPVIASNTSSLPEVLGESAILIDPNNASALSDAMSKVLHDNTVKTELRQKGFENIKRFKWQTSAKVVYNTISK